MFQIGFLKKGGPKKCVSWPLCPHHPAHQRKAKSGRVRPKRGEKPIDISALRGLKYLTSWKTLKEKGIHKKACPSMAHLTTFEWFLANETWKETRSLDQGHEYHETLRVSSSYSAPKEPRNKELQLISNHFP